jgi:hypothetical protein
LEGLGAQLFYTAQYADVQAAVVAAAMRELDREVLRWFRHNAITGAQLSKYFSISGKTLRVQSLLLAGELQQQQADDFIAGLNLQDSASILVGVAQCSSSSVELVVKLLLQLHTRLQEACDLQPDQLSREAAQAAPKLLQGTVLSGGYTGRLGPANKELVQDVTELALLLSKKGTSLLDTVSCGRLVIAMAHLGLWDFQLRPPPPPNQGPQPTSSSSSSSSSLLSRTVTSAATLGMVCWPGCC